MKIGYIDDKKILLDTFTNTFATKKIDITTWEFIIMRKNVLLQSVISAQVGMLLLDYHIDSIYKGTDLAQDLMKLGFTGIIVGFSTDPHTASIFKNIGVPYFVQKEPSNSLHSVEKVLSIMDMILDTK